MIIPARKSFASQVHTDLAVAHAQGFSVSGALRHRLRTYQDNTKVEVFVGDIRAGLDAAAVAVPSSRPSGSDAPTLRVALALATLALARRLLRA